MEMKKFVNENLLNCFNEINIINGGKKKNAQFPDIGTKIL